MKMTGITENTKLLQRLSDKRLIDLVKNYRQYGYDTELREAAISILTTRGITKEQLQLRGEFENKTYDSAQETYHSFRKTSNVAFAAYAILLVTNILVPVFSLDFEALSLFIRVINWSSLITYLSFLIISFMNQYKFYKIINKNYGTDGVLLYVFLGMPFYIFSYFYFRSQMKEKIQESKGLI
jgi:hypothetical protein